MEMLFSRHQYPLYCARLYVDGESIQSRCSFYRENIPFRYEVELGFALQKAQWKFHFMYKNRSPDNKRQPKKGHHLMNITLSHFFD